MEFSLTSSSIYKSLIIELLERILNSNLIKFDIKIFKENSGLVYINFVCFGNLI